MKIKFSWNGVSGHGEVVEGNPLPDGPFTAHEVERYRGFTIYEHRNDTGESLPNLLGVPDELELYNAQVSAPAETMKKAIDAMVDAPEKAKDYRAWRREFVRAGIATSGDYKDAHGANWSEGVA